MRKYGESKTTRNMTATVPHFTSISGLRKFQANGFSFDIVYIVISLCAALSKRRCHWTVWRDYEFCYF